MVRKGLLVILLSTSIFFLNNCDSSKKNNVVALGSTQQEKLKLGDVYKIIRLETSRESQFGTIFKAAVDIPNDRIFVLADFNVFIFNSEGRYIGKLKKGKGPGEIRGIDSFSLYPSKKIFYALDNASRICEFNYEGKMVRDFKLDNFYSAAIQAIDEDNVFLLCNWVGGIEDKFVGIYNFTQKRIVSRFISSSESKYPKLIRIMLNNFTVSKKTTYFYSSNVWSLFKYENKNFEKILSFDLGEREVPLRFSKKFLGRGKRHIFADEARLNGYVPFLLYSFYFKGYYIAIVNDEKSNCYAIDEKDYARVYNDGQLSSYFGLPNIKSLRFPRGVQDNNLIFSCNPLDFFDLNPEIKSKIVTIGNQNITLNYDENPFLIIVK